LNTRFEFPDSLELSPEGRPAATYRLNGAVLHSGQAVAGHYTSLIRLGGKWVKFNDTEVTEVTPTEFQRDSLGGEGRLSAYLLFYVDHAALVDGRTVLDTSRLPCLNDDQTTITQGDTRFHLEQCAFSPLLADAVVKSAPFPQARAYYFLVFCHSRMSDLARSFIACFDRAPKDELLDWLVEHFETAVLPVFSIAPPPRSSTLSPRSSSLS
jgi:hypothetical protein